MTSSVPLRAALYLRVSTPRQAEHDVSIPDQRRQGEAYCQARGYQLIETYVEPGATATNDRRPEFQKMMEAGTAKPRLRIGDRPFVQPFLPRSLRAGVLRQEARQERRPARLDDPGGWRRSHARHDAPDHGAVRRIPSKETAKHTLRALKENARQGFWNGSLPPIGYRVVDAEKRGAKVKKKLEIDPLHADTVRLAFRLALEGDGVSGSMGVKAIVKYLNERKLHTRTDGRWGVGAVHRMLTRPTYIGRHEFNKRSKAKTLKPADQIIAVPVPPLIDQATFDAVQAHLKSRNPKVTPPQVAAPPC